MPTSENDVNSRFTTAQEGALEMARRGFRVFPVKPNARVVYSKKAGDTDPVLCGGIHIGTTDAAVIGSWFAHNPTINYGIGTTGYVVVDVDVKKGPDGEWIAELQALGPLPETFRVLTPSGGQHIYFTGHSSQEGLSKCIDVRSFHGYVVGPGSVIDGVRYEVRTDAPVAPCPPAIVARLGKPKERQTASRVPLGELDTLAAYGRAVALLAGHPGVSEGNRDNECFLVACRVKDEGVSEPECLDLMLRFDAGKVHPPLGSDAIGEKVRSAYANGKLRPGVANPANEFEAIGDARTATGSLLEGSEDISIDELAEFDASALVQGLLYPKDDAVLYGESRSGKSFVALDKGWAVAQGRRWAGRRVQRAPVLYVAFEGENGFRKRMKAIEAVHGPAPWFKRLLVPVTLCKKNEGSAGVETIVAAAAELAAKCGQSVGMVTIDTLARATAGDNENDGADVMAFVELRSKAIRNRTGAAVLTLAHTNRSGDLRGSLHLRNAADAIFRAERDKDGTERGLIAEKVKDGQEMPLFDFTLRDVPLGVNRHGDAFGSAVIETTPPKAKAEKGSDAQERFRKVFESLVEDGGTVPLATIEAEYKRRFCADKTADATRKDWDRAHKTDGPPDGLAIEGLKGEEAVRRKPAGEGRRRGANPQDEFGAIGNLKPT